MDIEDLIRTAQARQADRAVPAERIRSALPARLTRSARQRRAGLALAAAAVVTAVTIPVLALRGTDTVTSPPAAPAVPSVAGPSTPPPSTPPAYRLDYRPAWTPPGFTERIRSADAGSPDDGVGPTVSRVWKKRVGRGDPWGGPQLTLLVRTAVADSANVLDTTGGTVDINGARGSYTPAQGDLKSSVAWTPDEHTLLMLTAHHLAISRSDLLRAARSVRPDPGPFTVPVRLPWLPTGWSVTSSTVSGPSAATWRGEVAVAQPTPEPATTKKDSAANGPGGLSVVVGSTTDAPGGGDSLSVGGRPARHPVRPDEAGRDLVYLVVDLGRGRLMTLVGHGSGIGLTELTRVAERAEIVPAGLDWLGR